MESLPAVEYFPPGVFSIDARVDQCERSWFSNALRSADEPALWTASGIQEGEVYRFTWLRSFHQPIVIRLTLDTNESGKLFAKVMSGSGGHGPADVSTRDEFRLIPADVASFLEKLQKAHFWGLPTKVPLSGLDGAEWIVEGVKDGKYHVVVRWSPKDGPYRDSCLYLMFTLATLRIPDPEVY